MKNNYLTCGIILFTAVIILSACSFAAPAANLTGTSWQLVSYGPSENQVAAVAEVETVLEFGKNGQVGGRLGCNSFSGDYKAGNRKIKFGALMSTEMACPEPQMTQESTAFQVMNGTVRYDVNSDSLTIYGPDGTNRLVLTRK